MIGKLAIFGDLGLVQHFKSVALKKFEAPPPVECHHLGVDLLDAMIVKIAEIGLEELTKDCDGLCFRKKVCVKMSDRPGSGGYLAPRF